VHNFNKNLAVFNTLSLLNSSVNLQLISLLRVRSTNRQQLLVPLCRLDTTRRAFSAAGPTVWNSLPDELTDPARGADSGQF